MKRKDSSPQKRKKKGFGNQRVSRPKEERASLKNKALLPKERGSSSTMERETCRREGACPTFSRGKSNILE